MCVHFSLLFDFFSSRATVISQTGASLSTFLSFLSLFPDTFPSRNTNFHRIMSRKPFCPQRSGICRVTPSYDWSSFCCFCCFIVWISSSWELTGMETPWALIFWGMRDHNPSLSPGHICLGRSVYEGIAGLSGPVSSSQHVHQLCAAPLPHGLYGWEVAHRPMHPATTRVMGERGCRSWAQGLGWETEESWGQRQCASLSLQFLSLDQQKEKHKFKWSVCWVRGRWTRFCYNSHF